MGAQEAEAAAAAEAARQAEGQRRAEAESYQQQEQARLQQEQAMQDEQDRQEAEAAAAAHRHNEDQGGGEEEPQMPEPAAPPAPAARAAANVNFAEPQGGEEEMPPPPQMERRAMPQRPTTARRPPPKLPSKEVKMERRERPKDPKHAGPGGPEIEAPTVIGVVNENDESEEEEEEVASAPLPGWDLGEKDGDSEVVEGEQHGALLADMMKEKQKLNAAGDNASGPAAQDEPASSGIIIKKKGNRATSSSASKRPGQSDTADIQKLRLSIQQLCQSTTPLGKCIEGVQGDLDHMEREFRSWKSESQLNARKLEQTSNNTDITLVPLLAQVGEEEQKIRDMKDCIGRVKANIMQNKITINALLKGVVAGHRN